MDEKKVSHAPLKPQITKILGVPRAANIAAVISGMLILIGILESAYLLRLSLVDITILSAILFLFYVILLVFLLKPRVVRIIKRMPGKKPMDEGKKKPAIEDIKAEVGRNKPVNITINNQTTSTKKKAKKSTKKRK